MSSASHPLDSRRFLFVTGKGGVGKTTVAASLALALAKRNKRVLIAQCVAHERLSAIMGTPPIEHEIVSVADNVWATNIRPDKAMEEYGQLVIKVKALARAVFDNKYTNAFFRAVPGLFEWAQLGKAWFHTTEKEKDGSNRFDVVLFDAPSTGHGLDMLRVPKVILDIVPPGILRRDAERAWDLFRDPKLGGVVVVTLAEEMPAQETIELVDALRNELTLPVAQLIVNAVFDPLLTTDERAHFLADDELMEAAREGTAKDAIAVALAGAARRASRESLQSEALAKLTDKLGLKPLVLPFIVGGAGSPDGIRELAQKL